jgi:WD40 repeat protein
MLKKTLLAFGCSLFIFQIFGQSLDLQVERLKAQVDKAAINDGRSKALALALLGYDVLGADNADLQRLLYETYYATSEFDMYQPEYTETIFNDAEWSPSADRVAVAVSDGMLRIYAASDFTKYLPVMSSTGLLTISWSPDGKTIAYGTVDGILGIFDIASETTTYSWEHADYIRAVAWSPKGDKLAAGGDENILYVYDVATREQERSFQSHTDWIRNISWSADGKMIAAASDDTTVTVWSITEGNLIKTHRSHEDYCRDVAFAPSGDALASCSDDLNVYIYDPATDNLPDLNLSGHEEWVMGLDWSPNGKMLATADNGGTIIVHTVRSGEQVFYNALDPETTWIDVDFAPKGDRFFAMGAYELAFYTLGTSTPTARILAAGNAEVTTAATENDLETLLATLLPSAFQLHPSPSGEYLGIIDADYSLQVLDLDAARILYTISEHGDWIRNIAWSADGTLLATASDDQMVGIWNARTGEMQHFLSGHTDWVRDVDFSSDNKLLASVGDDGVIRFWDVATGDELSTTDNVGTYLVTVLWSPDQKYIAAQSSEDLLYVWQASNNELIFTSSEPTMINSMKWLNDTKLQVQHRDGSPYQWTLAGGLEKASGAMGLEVSSKSGTKALAQGPYITLSGKTKGLLQGHQAQVVSLEWSPDEQYLISQGADGNLGIWNVAEQQLLALLPVTDGTAKTLVWSTTGSGFYLPGAPGKLLLPPTALREGLDTEQYYNILTADDVLRYRLENIFLKDAATLAKLKAVASPAVLQALADFYAQRATVQVEASAKAADEEMAKSLVAARGE